MQQNDRAYNVHSCWLSDRVYLLDSVSGLSSYIHYFGHFNFAHGAIGMFAAFIYWQLRWDSAWGGEWPAPLALAFVLLIVSPSLGILLQKIVMKGLEGTSETTKLSYPNSSYVGIYWHNELGMARF